MLIVSKCGNLNLLEPCGPVTDLYRYCFAINTAKSSGHYKRELLGMLERIAYPTAHRTTHRKTTCGSLWQQYKGQPILIRNRRTQHSKSTDIFTILEPAALLLERFKTGRAFYHLSPLSASAPSRVQMAKSASFGRNY